MGSEVRLPESFAEGSYAEMAPNYLSIAGRLVDRAGVDADDRVLDVGCGTGNVAITAARRGAEVTGVDLEPSMLERARENAAVAGVDVGWREGDAADLPLETDAFDVTLSSLGHMFAEPPAAAASELLRVTRPGGRVALASWTPTTLYPELGAVLLPALPPAARPDYEEPPFLWGDRDVVRERLGDGASALAFQTETVAYPAQSPAHFWAELSTHSGVFRDALAAVDESERDAIAERCVESIDPYFDRWENAVVLEYLVTEATVA
jgi:SAM-dependent methyltransferase